MYFFSNLITIRLNRSSPDDKQDIVYRKPERNQGRLIRIPANGCIFNPEFFKEVQVAYSIIGQFPYHLCHVEAYLITMLELNEQGVIIICCYIDNPAYFNPSLITSYGINHYQGKLYRVFFKCGIDHMVDFFKFVVLFYYFFV